MVLEKTSYNTEKTIENSLIKELHFTNNEMQLLLCAHIINKFVSISIKLYLNLLFLF